MPHANVLRTAAATLLALFIAVAPATAQAPPPPEEDGITAATYLELQLSSEPAAKLVLSQSLTFPFLRGSGPLTSENNITTVFSAEFTPVSLNGVGEINWTPAAFFVLSGGGMAGSGWNMPLGYGIGINRGDRDEPSPADPPQRSRVDGNAFDGLTWNAWGAATLQFDTGAVIPGYWNHVLFQTRHEFRYVAYTGAGPGQSWVFENDFRENQNGWRYRASYVIGYYMPLSPLLNVVAFMAELDTPLYNTPSGEFWGANLGYWIFSSFLNFSFTPRLNALFAVQMHTRRNHGTRNFNTTDYFYRDLALEREGGQRRVVFHRAALVINYRLR
ncbi:MAG: hypothetical protein FWC64_06870 [Treponema sp.]|nr:hypothetical protein [Treponema sp.]